jgi:hypothetical protein
MERRRTGGGRPGMARQGGGRQQARMTDEEKNGRERPLNDVSTGTLRLSTKAHYAEVGP